MYNIGVMNKLSFEKRTQVIRTLVEGNSIRATCRITGTAKGTVTRLFVSVGGDSPIGRGGADFALAGDTSCSPDPTCGNTCCFRAPNKHAGL